VKVPLVELFSQHWLPVLLGAASMVVCYALFYITTAFSLSYGVSTLGYSRETFLGLLCFAVLFMGLATPLAALASDRYGRKPVLIVGAVLAILSGLYHGTAVDPRFDLGRSTVFWPWSCS